MAKIQPDLSDPQRCISVHWNLPVQCELAPSHRENWHETTHPGTGNRLRYRYPGRLAEELRDGEWRPIAAPTEPFEPIDPDTERSLRRMVQDGIGGFSNRGMGQVLAELDRVRQLHEHAFEVGADGEPTDEPCACGVTYDKYDRALVLATAGSEG